jgi:hypothetical protein
MMTRLALLAVFTVIVLGTASTLEIMNSGCKSSHHAWCAPTSDMLHHFKSVHR